MSALSMICLFLSKLNLGVVTVVVMLTINYKLKSILKLNLFFIK